jgi:CDP-glucose 4,6-dehydratase
LKDKKVFITGHTGFKGAWLSLWLHQLGADVTGYSLAPPTEPSLYDLCRLDELVTSITGDVRDRAALQNALQRSQAEIVIHMAAQSLVRESYLNPVETYATNVMGTVNLLEAVRRCPSVKAVLNVTTDKCYENKEWVWGYRENEPLGGFDPYSNSKACSELVTAAYRSSFFHPKDYDTHRVAVATARAGNVIGGGDWAKDRIIPDCIRALLKGKPIRVRSHRAVRPWQYVLEPLHGYLLLARRLCEEGPTFAEAWNFGPPAEDARPVEWLVRRLCEQWGEGASYEMDTGEHPHEAHYLKLDCSKAHAKLAWHPRWNLERALAATISWTRDYRDGKDMRAASLAQIEEYVFSREETSPFEFVAEDGAEYRLAEWTEKDFNRESAAGAVQDDATTVKDLFDV